MLEGKQGHLHRKCCNPAQQMGQGDAAGLLSPLFEQGRPSNCGRSNIPA